MKLTNYTLNKGFYYLISILVLGFTFSLMIFAASDIYGDQEGGAGNTWSHLIRIGIIVCGIITIASNNFKLGNSTLIKYIGLWIFWMFICNISTPDRYVTNLTFVLLWPIVFLAFNIIRKSKLEEKFIARLFICLFIIASLIYSVVLQARNIDIEGRLASVNHIYFIVLLLPGVLLIKSGLIRNGFLIGIVLLTVLSAKRGAMLAIFVSSAIYIYYTYVKNKGKGINGFGLFLGIILIMGISYLFTIINDSYGGYLLSRFERLEEDKGSGRLDIYAEVLTNFNNSPWYEKLIGHGHNMVKQSTSFFLSAHNDYLEVLYDYGIIGLIIVLLIVKELIKRSIQLYRCKSLNFANYFSAVIIFLFMTTVSHIILYPTYIVFLAIYFGYMEPIISQEIKNK